MFLLSHLRVQAVHDDRAGEKTIIFMFYLQKGALFLAVRLLDFLGHLLRSISLF